MPPARPRRGLLLVAVLGLVAVLSGCHRGARSRPKVLASIFPVYDLTRRIAGPDADVLLLAPVGVSPHAYSSSAADLDRVAGANLTVIIGLDLDAWAQPTVTAGARPPRVLRLVDRVPTLPRASVPPGPRDPSPPAPVAGDGQGGETVDVHAWLDPQRALLMARAISDELCRVDPTHATAYRGRSLAVTQSLERLDQETLARTAAWRVRTFATLHDDLRYYAARYRLEVGAVVEARPGVSPAPAEQALLAARLRELHAAAVFGEPQLDSEPARALARATGLPYGVLDPLGGTPGVDSYEALIRYDTDALDRALSTPQAAAPPVRLP